MLQSGKGCLLRIFIGENDKYESRPLFEWIIAEAKKQKLAGATAYRGCEGFGAQSHLHTAKILRLSQDLPVIVEIVETREKIDAFLPKVDDAVKEGLVTLQEIDIHFYGNA
jgi:PII-like signaling protein